MGTARIGTPFAERLAQRAVRVGVREFPELCSAYNYRGRSRGTGLQVVGPYCPECAPKVEAELLEIGDMYRGW